MEEEEEGREHDHRGSGRQKPRMAVEELEGITCGAGLQWGRHTVRLGQLGKALLSEAFSG